MSGGVPPSSRARSRAPLSRNAQVQKAARLYERFSGHEAEYAGTIDVKPLPAVGVAIGKLDGVLYSTVRDGKAENYIHKFALKDRPLFVVAPDGKSMFIVGGRYTFTERGIVDKSDKSK